MIKTLIKIAIAIAAFTAVCYGYSAMLESVDRNSTRQSQAMNWGIKSDSPIHFRR